MLAYSPPIFLTAVRMLIAGSLLLFFISLRKRKEFHLNKVQIFSLFVLGFFSIYLTNILEFWGLQYLSAAKTCFIYSLSPFFAALFSYLHFKEKITTRKIFGLLIGFLGFIPILTMQSDSENILSAFSILTWPELAIMGAALFSVYGWVVLRLIVKNHTVSPLMANGSSMMIGGIFALVHSYFFEAWNPVPIAAGSSVKFVQGILLITLISNILCYNLYGFMLKRFTATFLSFAGLLSPIFASLNSWMLMGEKPSWLIFLSTGIVSFGLWIVYKEELRLGYILRKKKVLSKSS
ncbi:MAG: DMT family transporter [Simkaniaceae bacterium]